ncbi:glycosyltransferase [bacterium]|nr:glycosyltransferase [bacterium]
MTILILSIFWACYLINWTLLLHYLQKSEKKHIDANKNTEYISILIPVRNEIAVLPSLFKSLDSLDYPTDLLEILLIDDCSTDNSLIQIQDFCSSRKHATYIKADTPLGKAQALDLLSTSSKGDVLFFTDADCTVPANWIYDHLEKYNAGTGLVAGNVCIKTSSNNNKIFNFWQNLDWIRFSTAGSMWINLGKPLSIFGNNFSVRREVYLDAGGFAEAAHSITEDYTLLANIIKTSSLKIKCVEPSKNWIETAPEHNFNDFLRQRRRWAIGARGRSAISTFLTIIAIAPFWIIILTFAMEYSIAGISSLLIWILLEFNINYTLLNQKQTSPGILQILTYPFFFTFYTLCALPAFFTAHKIQWKGRDIDVKAQKL